MKNGNARVAHDASIEGRYMIAREQGYREHTFDMTDKQKDKFAYIY